MTTRSGVRCRRDATGPAVSAEPVVFGGPLRPLSVTSEGSALLLAQDRAQPLGSGGRLVGATTVAAHRVEGLELLGEVVLQARAVLTLEGVQLLDLGGELVLLALEVAEQ